MPEGDDVENNYQVVIELAAPREMAAALEWYRSKGSQLEAGFRRVLNVRLPAIERNPLTYPVIYKLARRALLQKSPYGIIYLESDTVVIISCSHTRRDPKQWQTRLEPTGEN